MQEFWVGKRYLKDLRECKLVSLKTGRIKFFLASEEDIEKTKEIAESCDNRFLRVKRTEDYSVA